MDQHPASQGSASGEDTVSIRDTISVRVGTHIYFARDHLRAAQFMAESCQRREQRCVEDGRTGIDSETRSYALAAIMEAVAFLEAALNQLWHQAIEYGATMSSPYLEGLDQPVVNLLRELGGNNRVERALGILEKYDLTLLCAGREPIDKGRTPGQDVKALINARNALVHYKPELHWEDEAHNLETQLRHLVPPNPLMKGGGPWFPHHLLCAGVAQWACAKSVELVDEWNQTLGLKLDYNSMGSGYWTTTDDDVTDDT